MNTRSGEQRAPHRRRRRKPVGEALKGIVSVDPAIEHVKGVATMYLGPDDILLALEVRFRSDTTVVDVRRAVARVRQAIESGCARIRRIVVNGTSICDCHTFDEGL